MRRKASAPLPNAYWVQPGRFLAGPYPTATRMEDTRERLRRLLHSGVTCFLDLTEEGEYGVESYVSILQEEARALGVEVEYKRWPIADMETPSVAQMALTLDAIDAALGAGCTLYLHCLGGLGRTGTVLGCYLVRHGMDGGTALSEIARLRQGTPTQREPSPVTPSQRAMVRNWPVGM